MLSACSSPVGNKKVTDDSRLYKIDDWIYYSEADHDNNSGKIIRFRQDNFEKQVFFTYDAPIESVNRFDKNNLYIGVYNGESMDFGCIDYFIFNLKDKTMSPLFDEKKFKKSDFYCLDLRDDDIFFLTNMSDDYVFGDLYKKDKNGNYTLLQSKVKNYITTDSSIYYSDENDSIISMDFDGKNKKVIDGIKTDELGQFNIFGDLIFVQRTDPNPYLQIYNTIEKGNIEITGHYNSYNLIFDRDFFITEFFENDTKYFVKVSYDGKSIQKITEFNDDYDAYGKYFVLSLAILYIFFRRM
jgi:hypothetical protein